MASLLKLAARSLALTTAFAIFKRGGRSSAPVEWLIVGLGNPGTRYAKTRHNVGFRVAEALIDRYELGKPKSRYRARFVEGRLGPSGPRVAIMMPETFMNESGQSVSPARGELRVEPDHVIAVYDEIDFPFGRIEARLGGGHGGHNGVKSLKQGLGTAEFRRVRVGVGRPDSTDPEIVSAWVLGGFTERQSEVDALVDDAANEVIRLIEADPPAS